jgi:hypothetical protein
MRESGEPTWRLVLLAAQRLDAVTGEFRMQDLVAEVQRMDPSRGRGSIQPVIQGMTANAGGGPVLAPPSAQRHVPSRACAFARNAPAARKRAAAEQPLRLDR